MISPLGAAMNSRLCRTSALAGLLFALAGCSAAAPYWSTHTTAISVVGSLQESLSTSTLSLAAGGSASFSVTLTPAGGFAGLVQFAPVNSQPGVTFSPSSVDIEGTAAVTIPITVTATASAEVSTRAVTFCAASTDQAVQAPLSITVSN
jgi:hypothetical protein